MLKYDIIRVGMKLILGSQMKGEFDMSEIYPFKRSFYYDVENAIKESSVAFVLGPRRCGKSVCMLQLEKTFSQSDEFDRVVYADAKRNFGNSLDKSKFINEVRKAIENDEKALFLIDEATYLNQPDGAIMDVQDAFTCHKNTNTKVVFTGSQSIALDCWGHRAFAGDAKFVTADFLSYPEWLAFKGFSEVSEDTYLQFLGGTREFYSNFHSTKDYLRGCLDETIISNHKSLNVVDGNDCKGLTDEMLLDVLYASMMSLHNHSSYSSIAKKSVLEDTISRFFADEVSKIGNDFKARVSDILSERYENFRNMTGSDLLKSLQFLDNCGLVTVTPVRNELKVDTYYTKNLLSGFGEKLDKDSLMKDVNVCIKYPMFYMDIVQSLLKENMPDKIPNNLLGSIVECHVRGLLPTTGCMEYRKDNTDEIDYVNTSRKTAVEITVSDKKLSSVHFDVLPESDDYRKILLSKTKAKELYGIEFVPYYRFIYDNSVGTDIAYPLTHIPYEKRSAEHPIIVTPIKNACSGESPQIGNNKSVPKQEGHGDNT